MVCMGTRLYQLIRNQRLTLRQVARHASTSILFTKRLSSPRPRINSVYHYEPRRSKHCRRVDSCGEKKKKEKENEVILKKKQSSLWGQLFGIRKKKLPRIETCRRLKALQAWEEEKIPDFIKEMCENLPEGSAIYRTEGHAFLVEVPCKKPKEKKKTKEEILLAKMERDKRARIIEDENNPMPSTHPNPGVRWIDLNDRCLHPLYKKMEIACPVKRKEYVFTEEKKKPDDLTWEHHRHKQNFCDFKMGVLPRYLELRENETMVNKYNKLDHKQEKLKACRFRPCPMTECHLDCERWKPKNILKKKL